MVNVTGVLHGEGIVCEIHGLEVRNKKIRKVKFRLDKMWQKLTMFIRKEHRLYFAKWEDNLWAVLA